MADELIALLDIEQIAEALRTSSDVARPLLDLHGEAPAATYRGRPLWLSDAVHELVAEHSCATG